MDKDNETTAETVEQPLGSLPSAAAPAAALGGPAVPPPTPPYGPFVAPPAAPSGGHRGALTIVGGIVAGLLLVGIGFGGGLVVGHLTAGDHSGRNQAGMYQMRGGNQGRGSFDGMPGNGQRNNAPGNRAGDGQGGNGSGGVVPYPGWSGSTSPSPSATPSS